MKMKAAAYRLRNQLGMPVPMPYFHSLCMLQNINFAIYSYAMCYFESFLTPIILFVVILITVGMREVAVALSNPYGKDDVDFRVNKWIVVQLRSMALIAAAEEESNEIKNYSSGAPKLPQYRRRGSLTPADAMKLGQVNGHGRKSRSSKEDHTGGSEDDLEM